MPGFDGTGPRGMGPMTGGAGATAAGGLLQLLDPTGLSQEEDGVIPIMVQDPQPPTI
jgi:hypothetical protein